MIMNECVDPNAFIMEVSYFEYKMGDIVEHFSKAMTKFVTITEPTDSYDSLSHIECKKGKQCT